MLVHRGDVKTTSIPIERRHLTHLYAKHSTIVNYSEQQCRLKNILRGSNFIFLLQTNEKYSRV